jgi:hypothetical protein
MLHRRAFLGVLAIIVALMMTTGSALALFIHHVPAYYQRAALVKPEDRDDHCREFIGRLSEGLTPGERSWDREFTQEQVNSYFQSQDQKSDLSARLVEIPDSVKDIRVEFEDDIVRVGFRYGQAGWKSCIVSVEFRTWLVAHKPNLIALELCDFRAGALPLGTRSLIDFITEAARRENIAVTWFRHGGHPIALLQLQANQSRPTFQLRRLEVHRGRLEIASSPTREAVAAPPLSGSLAPHADPQAPLPAN